MPTRRCLLALTFSSPALAQPGWLPSGPVRVVVPFPPGAGIDILARVLAPAAQAGLGQPVVVENRPGAGTLIATEAMARTAPDGQALLFVANSFVINPHLRSVATYDPLRDFAPVALLTVVPHVLVAHPSVAADFAGFLARGRQAGAGMSFGSNGSGTSLHLGAEQLKMLAGLNATHVPYRGTPQVLADLIAGRVDWMFGNLPDVLASVKEGKLRALAVVSAGRSAFLPEVPTIGEVGFPQVQTDSNYGLVLPAGARPEVVARHEAAWLAAVQMPAVRQVLEGQGFEILARDAAAFRAKIGRDGAGYAAIIKAAGVTAD
jgi:tripartite-type tricarboxylate transporter receptor subunit TctC